MSFLAPLFLLGGLAVALPIVFHLIRRTSREKVPFSSLMFLTPSPPRITRRSRLEHIVLLLLRCLVIGLLALGFARPFFSKSVTGEVTPGSGTWTVLLLDTSASMRRDNLWPAARSKAIELLESAEPEDRVAVLAFDRQVRVVTPFDDWASIPANLRAERTTSRIDAIEPGWASTQTGAALLTAVQTLQEAERPEELAPPIRRIVLISDLQQGSQINDVQGLDWPRGIELIVEQVEARRPTNAGLQWVRDLRSMESDLTEPIPRVRVSNSPDAAGEQFKIGWSGLEGSGFVGTADEVYVPPGRSRILRAPQPLEGTDVFRLSLTGDEQSFDNAVYLVPQRKETSAVLYLGNEAVTDAKQPFYYLQRVFGGSRARVIELVSNSPDQPFLQQQLDLAPLMIITTEVPTDRLPALRSFLESGKTVLAVLKDPEAAATLGPLIGIPPIPVAEEPAPRGYLMLGEIDFRHPLFAPFADPRYSDFTKIHFWKYRRLDADRLPGALVLARFENRDPALIQVPIGNGSLFILTSGWHPSDSQLALSSKFVPLLYSLFEQGSGARERRVDYTVGDPVELSSTNHTTDWVIRKPDGAEVTVPAGEPFRDTDRPGIYTILSGEKPERLAVNLAAEESRTAPMPIEQLTQFGAPLGEDRKASPAETARRAEQLLATELENNQKLWRWLIAAAIVFLFVETWMASRLTVRMARTPASS